MALDPRRADAVDAADRIVPVTTAIVVRRDEPVIVEGLGTVTPLATVTVHTQVDGRLERVFFKEGDALKKGDPIGQIDARPLTIQLRQAEAAMARDTAALNKSQLILTRYEELRKSNLISEQQVATQRALVAQQGAAAKADEASIASARLSLEYARMVSPIDGVTGVRLVDPGNVVHANDPTGIVIVTQLDPIAVMDLRRALAAATVDSPKGAVSNATQTRRIGANDQLFGASAFRELVIRRSPVTGAIVRLHEVADVVDSVENERVAAWADGVRAVLVIIRRQTGANIVETNDRIKQLMPTLATSISPAIKLEVALDSTQAIRASVREVEHTLLISVLLVVGVVFVFLRSVRATAVPAVVVPLSLVGTFAFMYLLD